jgi:hypothetical protein
MINIREKILQKSTMAVPELEDLYKTYVLERNHVFRENVVPYVPGCASAAHPLALPSCSVLRREGRATATAA